MLDSDQMRFLVIGERFDFSFPKSIKVKPAAKTLNRKDGRQLQLSLFEFVPEDEFNETEKAVARYLEGQKRKMFSICTKEAKSRSWSDLGLVMKGKGFTVRGIGRR